MPNLIRVRVRWDGAGVIGPGVSTFHLDESATGYVAALAAFFTSYKTSVPNQVTWTIPGSGDTIDVATGVINGTWTSGTTTAVTATATGTWAQGVGVRNQWLTSGIRNGRRVRGTTFIVPVTVAQYDVNGVLSTAAVALYQGYCNTLLTALGGYLRVYSRPTEESPGQSNVVTAALVPNAVTWLRSRRT